MNFQSEMNILLNEEQLLIQQKIEIENKLKAIQGRRHQILDGARQLLQQYQIPVKQVYPQKPPVKYTPHAPRASYDDEQPGLAPPQKEGRLQKVYKVAICKYWQQGKCTNTKETCNFAHGADDIYKTPKPCLNWDKTGRCPYGKNCTFTHYENRSVNIPGQYRKKGFMKI